MRYSIGTPGLLLLVEDNADDEELALMAFEQGGISNRVIVTRDGVEALDYLFSRGIYRDRSPEDLPALILLDLQLPKINGLEVLQQIKSNPKTQLIPVVILTTSTEQKDLVESYSLGCNSYIQKPVDYDQFLRVIQQLGMYWLDINSPPPLSVAYDE
ncbi:two-component system response regulator [[Phormidium ambiguum] IAM M-71]|uniref:Two-component system response regulator n=1 Tax=[Phormidium ambiguum] IAM M-71 TaxID=454136 RepID=A0A1U7IQ14_9CYAN|nr:response regulator [Phormidium ambiguum]OKH39510.1 two-component system response regulator [Phormidium ambiguum IAM M-71]